MKSLCLFALSLIVLSGTSVAQTIDNQQFVSSSLNGKVIPVTTYLPAGYSTSAPPYRVYIFLHGAGTQTHGSNVYTVTAALEQAIAEGIAEPMVIIFPGFEGAAPGYEPLFLNSHGYRNSARNGPFEDGVMIDLMDWLYTISGYNISADREERAIGGFSDGAAGCAYLAVKHCDQFAAFVAHSGGLSVRDFEDTFLLLLLAETQGPPYTFDPAIGIWNEFAFARSTAFSPNLVDPNYPVQLVDFPVDSTGALIPEVFDDCWIANHDPATLIANPSIYTHPVHMYFNCSTEDVNYASNQRFSNELTTLGIRHKFKTYTGGHTLTIPIVKNSLRWLTNRFNDPPSDVSEVGGRHAGAFVLEGNHPNPFHAVTTIRFSLPLPAQADLRVYDLGGRLVRTLVNGRRPEGSHAASWDGRDDAGQPVAAGVYFVRLRSDRQSESLKVMLVK